MSAGSGGGLGRRTGPYHPAASSTTIPADDVTALRQIGGADRLRGWLAENGAREPSPRKELESREGLSVLWARRGRRALVGTVARPERGNRNNMLLWAGCRAVENGTLTEPGDDMWTALAETASAGGPARRRDRHHPGLGPATPRRPRSTGAKRHDVRRPAMTNGQGVFTDEDEETIEDLRQDDRLKTEARRRNKEEDEGDGPTSWEPVDLGPYLRGEIQIPEPTVGLARGDGVRLLYPGLEHSVIAETEAGKTWIADACTAAEIEAGNQVVYVHYEEADPASTIERLLLLGADADEVERLLTFVGPFRPVRQEYLADLLVPAPTLVVHDGMNEAMALHGAMTKEVEGAAFFRQRLVLPFLRWVLPP